MQTGRVLRAAFCLVVLILPIQSAPSMAVSANPSPTCSGAACSIDFVYTGDYYQWSAPISGSYTFETWGAKGGDITDTYAIAGAKGGYAKGSMNLTAGQTIYIYVGGKGADRLGNHVYNGYVSVAGGWNGGGPTTSWGNGSPGGGGTDLRISGTALANRVIVAGGGGGGGWIYAKGGEGGGTTGTNGTQSNQTGTGASGGTQLAGGAVGSAGGTYKTAGSLGQGGSGSGSSAGGGGGGGGYYGGGGGGYNDGGGGGSSYVGTLTTAQTINGASVMPNPAGGTMTGRNGDGYARISYTAPTNTTTTLGLSGDVTTIEKRKSINLTATVTVAGKVTFFSNGKRIAGCINKAAASTTAICSIKPSVLGRAMFTASFTPLNNAYLPSVSSGITVNVVPRTGTR